ncbi:hypothetical protein BABINDRAFT_163266 [Babjeviella inositovora NRRL Y-12698]|uniref:Uncharacterized protein n=1 Tax=Babjeviella inositovora NRRL Y-12698 TaxID=984486 RepID=A0A1E3QKA5_9ASCO|nr:uncharacterized protein BABINDRAFT_163266 [Babjeviella inositovora NRRL Y-12698]ODQ77894.1 hypothetical protein BABINDRAFT_163266 [Babjeviella inositovora NRRL Y-12698]
MFLALSRFSDVFGMLYVFLWSVSYYPTFFKYQRDIRSIRDVTTRYKPLTSYQEKEEGHIKPGGLSINYLLLNIFGYVIYLVAIWLQLFHQETKRQFASQSQHTTDSQDQPATLIDYYDLVFYVHGMCMNLVFLYQVVTLSRAQSLYLRSFLRSAAVAPLLKVNMVVKLIVVLMLLVIVRNWFADYEDEFSYVAFIRVLSTLKMATSFFKFIPQMILNYKTKSMGGLAINGIWLDVLGNILFFIQLVMSCEMILEARNDHISTVFDVMAENPGKVGILLVGFGFNVISIVQYYVLYANTVEEERNDKVV